MTFGFDLCSCLTDEANVSRFICVKHAVKTCTLEGPEVLLIYQASEKQGSCLHISNHTND